MRSASDLFPDGLAACTKMVDEAVGDGRAFAGAEAGAL